MRELDERLNKRKLNAGTSAAAGGGAASSVKETCTSDTDKILAQYYLDVAALVQCMREFAPIARELNDVSAGKNKPKLGVLVGELSRAFPSLSQLYSEVKEAERFG